MCDWYTTHLQSLDVNAVPIKYIKYEPLARDLITLYIFWWHYFSVQYSNLQHHKPRDCRLLWSHWENMMTSSSGNIFRVPGLCAGNSPVPENSPHKGQWRGALMFSLICVWINSWTNNREAGDLRCYCAHYDVIVMVIEKMVRDWKWIPVLNFSRMYTDCPFLYEYFSK